MLTLAALNKRVKTLSPDVNVSRGKGYFYFWGKPCVKWLKPCVFVKNINDLSMKEWERELLSRLMEYPK